MRRATVAGAILCVALAACLFPSLDGLSGDAGPDANSDSGDASFDATIDSPTDQNAADVLDGAPAAFSCAQVDAQFCDDFDDEDGGNFAHWSNMYVARGGTVTRAPSDASPPFTSQFDCAAWMDGGSPYAVLTRYFTTAMTASATLSFDLRIEQWPSSATASFNTGDLVFDTSVGCGTNLVLRQAGSWLQETVVTDAGTSYPAHPLAMTPALGVWTHVEMRWTFSPGAITVTVLFDGQTVLNPTTLDSRLTYGIPRVALGETYEDPAADHLSFAIDDVVFQFE